MFDTMNAIPLSVPNICGNELRYVTDAVSGGWVAEGKYLGKFEDSFARYAGTNGAAACQSGTAALHLALLDAGVGPGDLVAVPTLTFIAAVNPIRYSGAEPVFMDCDDSLCIDPNKFLRYLERECDTKSDGYCYDRASGKPVKAVIVVHIFGNMAKSARIAEIAGSRGIKVIEDATEAVGTFACDNADGTGIRGKMAGTFGDYGVYSFNGNKIVTTGGGGMVTAKRELSLKHIRHLAAQAKTDPVRYTHDEIGYNYRMSNVQAAIGLAQLEQLEDFIGVKRRNYLLYKELGIELLPFCEDTRPNYWFYSVMCTSREARDGLIDALRDNGIQARPIWALCHTQPMYLNCGAYEIEIANNYHERVVNLPCSTSLTAADLRRVAGLVKYFFEIR